MAEFITNILNTLKEWIVSVVELLPKSPFQFENADEFRTILGYINYFIPIGAMVNVMVSWLGCIVFWYGAMIVLRWIKAIE